MQLKTTFSSSSSWFSTSVWWVGRYRHLLFPCDQCLQRLVSWRHPHLPSCKLGTWDSFNISKLGIQHIWLNFVIQSQSKLQNRPTVQKLTPKCKSCPILAARAILYACETLILSASCLSLAIERQENCAHLRRMLEVLGLCACMSSWRLWNMKEGFLNVEHTNAYFLTSENETTTKVAAVTPAMPRIVPPGFKSIDLFESNSNFNIILST